MPESVDLHSHSTASDGTFAPAAVARLAHDAGLVGLALTDHDTVAGVPECAAEAHRLGLAFLPGIEISAIAPTPNGTLHILGYGVDPASPALADMTRALIEARDHRNPRIVARLRELGIDITLEEVLDHARNAQHAGAEHAGSARSAAPDPLPAQLPVIGRPHIAAVLVRKNIVPTIKKAFDDYLGQTGQAWVDKERLAPRAAIDCIRQSAGVAVLAHPVQLRTTNLAQLTQTIKDLADLGLEGIEVLHSDHTPDLTDTYTALARRFNLLPTGGSDFHGHNKKDIPLGSARGRQIPKEWMDALIARAGSHRTP
ncbi:MAG TPA: PHP domain-containing protein [Tepidisphaeraceae bacterium]|nr:PHP domain-containing protein [Tepidisphaeraceae bacterium]